MADDNLTDDEMRELQEVIRNMRTSTLKTSQNMTDIINKVASGMKITRAEFDQFNKELGMTTRALSEMRSEFMGAISGVVGLTSAMGRGTDGFSLFNQAIDATAAAAKGLFSSFTFLAGKLNPLAAVMADTVGEFSKGAIEIGADIAKYMVGTFEEGTKTFIQLSKVGAIGAAGIQDMADKFETLGLPMGKYAQLLQQNSGALARMGGSVSNATTSVVEALGGLKESGADQGLRNIGFASEEIADTMIAYADLQRRLGQTQLGDQMALQQGTMAYAKELDEIARITGMSREQAQKEADAAMANARFNATIRQMMAEGRTQEVAELRKMNAYYTQFGMEKGFQDMVTGFMNTSDAISLFNQSQGAVYEAAMAAKNGQMDATQALQMHQAGLAKNEAMLTSVAQAGGNLSGQLGNFSQGMNFLGAEIDKTTLAQAEQNAATSKPNVATANLMKAAANLEQAAATLQAAFVGTESAPALMKQASEIMKSGSITLADAIKSFKSLNLTDYSAPAGVSTVQGAAGPTPTAGPTAPNQTIQNYVSTPASPTTKLQPVEIPTSNGLPITANVGGTMPSDSAADAVMQQYAKSLEEFNATQKLTNSKLDGIQSTLQKGNTIQAEK